MRKARAIRRAHQPSRAPPPLLAALSVARRIEEMVVVVVVVGAVGVPVGGVWM